MRSRSRRASPRATSRSAASSSARRSRSPSGARPRRGRLAPRLHVLGPRERGRRGSREPRHHRARRPPRARTRARDRDPASARATARPRARDRDSRRARSRRRRPDRSGAARRRSRSHRPRHAEVTRATESSPARSSAVAGGQRRGRASDPFPHGLVVASAIGHITPPAGLCLLVDMAISGLPMEKLVGRCSVSRHRDSAPVLAFVPEIDLYLPRPRFHAVDHSVNFRRIEYQVRFGGAGLHERWFGRGRGLRRGCSVMEADASRYRGKAQ